jgi:hypothetical protein
MEPNRPTLPGHTAEAMSPPQPSGWSFLPQGRSRRAVVCAVVSTVLSGVGLIGLALFEQYNSALSELHNDLKHFNETSGEYVKKDRLQKCWEHLRECAHATNAANAARERLETELKASERSREDLAREMQRLRERLSYLEGMKAAAGSDRTKQLTRCEWDGIVDSNR